MRQRSSPSWAIEQVGELVDQLPVGEALAEHRVEVLVERLDLEPRKVLERLAQHVLARGEPVGGRAEGDVRRLRHGAVGDPVDSVLGDQAKRRLKEKQSSRAAFGGDLGVHLYCTIVHNMSEGEFVVIGGGVVGVASALALARSGAAVELIERESAVTATGSSKGGARIFAPAAYPDESYLEMGLRAVDLWRAIEADAGTELLSTTGALTTGAFAEPALAALRAAGERAELLTPTETMRRFGVETGGRPALHQPDAGVIRADRAYAALLALADRAGVSIRRGEAAISVEATASGAEVVTDRRRVRMRRRGGRRRSLEPPVAGARRDRAGGDRDRADRRPPRPSRGRPAADRADGLRRRRAVRAVGSASTA